MSSSDAAADAAGPHRFFVTLPLNGRDTRVGVLRLWDESIADDDGSFRGEVADAFAAVWPNRGGECNSIRRGLYRPERKPTPLVLVPLDGPDAYKLVLGYTIIYPSSTVNVNVNVNVARDGTMQKREQQKQQQEQVTNCTLNSVLVPPHLRGLHLGQALVKLAVHAAVREMNFACVTAWCQPEKMPFYKSCGFVYEPPKRKTAPMNNLSKGRKEALWAKLLGQESAGEAGEEGENAEGVKEKEGGGEARGSGGGDDDDSSSDSGDDDGLDECMRLFASDDAGGDNLPPLL